MQKILGRPIDGVGPQTSRVLRLALDAKGYPRGDMLAYLASAPLEEVLDLEAVSMRRRVEVSEVSLLSEERAKAAREAAAKARPGARR